MAKTKDGEWFECDQPECETKVKNHAWGYIKAEGWFFSRDGERGYCPEHVPAWVSEWRKKRKKKSG